METYQVVQDGLHGEVVACGVDHGGSEGEARRVLHQHTVDQVLEERME